MPEIVIRGLSKAFGKERALDNVSFEVRDGEFLTLLGPSGCGKTTTLMSIAGLVRPDAGRIICGPQTFFDHRENVHLSAEERNLGIVFQSYAIWPHMTVARNVGFPLEVRRLPKPEIRERVSATLELVELSPYESRYPHELSGGQQQRVALARALVYSPSVLLLDEPFSNLDAKLRERARSWLKHLQAELSLTTVFVTHDQDEALSMSDRILVMDCGAIRQGGTPAYVYAQPASRFVAEFVGRCNILSGRIVAGDDGSTRVAVDPTGAELTIAERDLPEGAIVEIALRPESIELSEGGLPTAENVFAAELRATSFLGHHYVYELAADGLELIATDKRAFAGPLLTVRIPPEACHVLGQPSRLAVSNRSIDGEPGLVGS
jgi:iron(III) transport system ATP-binding protein